MEQGLSPRETLDLPTAPESTVPELDFPAQPEAPISESGEMEGFLSDKRKGVPPVTESDIIEQSMRNWQSRQSAMDDLIDLIWKNRK
jgi:hypothetical protein